jgi:pimeloyl-ACP methyl ester carboxylesterase
VTTVRVAGEAFAVRDEGRGAPVLLVHGFPLDHRMWSAQVEALRPRHRVIAPDLRGFGGSVVTDGAVTMEHYANDLAAILDALAVAEPVAYVGFSMGGYVGWAFLRRHAHRVARLVACDTRAVGDAAEAAAGRLAMAERVLAEGAGVAADAMLPKLLAPGREARDPELGRRVRGMILDTDPRGIAAAQRGMARRRDATGDLPAIDLPALVIVGEHDAISTRDERRSIADALPDGRYVLVKGAGHLAPMEAPDAVSAALREFLDPAS